MTPKPVPSLDREAVTAERLDAIRQRDEAQQQANEAQALLQRAQQMGQEAGQRLLVANGMVQQNDAYLKLLDKLANGGSPAIIENPT